MKKLEKREIIILVVMGVAIIYGASTFLPGGGKKTQAARKALSATELTSLTTELSAAMGKNVLSAGDVYAAAEAEKEWLHDPFYERKSYSELLKSKEVAKTALDKGEKVIFKYTGYLEYGNRKIAIINGTEYAAGEALETTGYRLKLITPTKVVIENTIDNEKINVPIED